MITTGSFYSFAAVFNCGPGGSHGSRLQATGKAWQDSMLNRDTVSSCYRIRNGTSLGLTAKKGDYPKNTGGDENPLIDT